MMAQLNKRQKRGAYFQYILNPFDAVPRHVLQGPRAREPDDELGNMTGMITKNVISIVEQLTL